MKITEKQITKTIDHPLEDILNITPNTTISTHTERQTELTKIDQYDEKDVELEETYQEIYDKALTGYENLCDEMETVEPKYLPRLGEVAISYLNTALASATHKARLKEHKDKLAAKRTTIKSPNVVNNTLIMNREDLLKEVKLSNVPIIDVEHKVIEGKPNDNE